MVNVDSSTVPQIGMENQSTKGNGKRPIDHIRTAMVGKVVISAFVYSGFSFRSAVEVHTCG